MHKIPVFINNRDWLSSTRRQVEILHGWNAEPVIVDNASTYPPLLEWYDFDCPARVIRLQSNYGPFAPFFADVVPRQIDDGFFAVTDADLAISTVPDDALYVLIAGLEKYPHHVKCGLSMETGDLPKDAPCTDMVRINEQANCHRRLDDRYVEAPVDTTFAVYRNGETHFNARKLSLRAGKPYTARHLPWYITTSNITDEQRYYLQHAETSGVRYTGYLKATFCEATA